MNEHKRVGEPKWWNAGWEHRKADNRTIEKIFRGTARAAIQEQLDEAATEAYDHDLEVEHAEAIHL